jgi:Copper amine oxidase N-terminal domain
VNIKLEHSESWFNLDKSSFNVAGGSTGIILITLVNSEFKAGDEKIGHIEISWSNGSQKVSVTAKTNEDTLPPEITILELEEKVTDLSEVTLSGSTNEKCEIFINGEVIAENDDSFEFVFELKKAPSKNSVVITATDSAGNTSTMEFEIINNHMLTIKTSINNKILYTDGVPVELDVAPTIVNGRTLAPFRAIVEAFGAEVAWIAETKTVVMTLGDIILELPIGKKLAKISGKEIEIDPPAQIIEGRTMVPLRFVGEAFGADVDWDDSTKTITIMKLIVP